MKRDMDLVREILRYVENRAAGQREISQIEIEGYDEATIAEHVDLLTDAELLEATIAEQRNPTRIFYSVSKVTWKGHEFLAAARDRQHLDSSEGSDYQTRVSDHL